MALAEEIEAAGIIWFADSNAEWRPDQRVVRRRISQSQRGRSAEGL